MDIWGGTCVVRHIVVWKLKDEAEGHDKATNAAKMAERLRSLEGKIDGLIKLEVGINSMPSAGAYDVALVADFVDEAALAAYQVHPLHVKVAEFIALVRAERAVVDYMM